MNQTILITGACGNIGNALAKHWDTQHHLLLLDNDSLALQKLDDELSGDHTLIPFDLWTSEPDLYQTLATMICEDYGKIDALVHLAAYCGNLRPLIQTDPEKWLKSLQVNLTAPLWLCQTLLPLLEKSPHGKIGFTTFDTLGRDSAHQAHYWHGFGVAQAGLSRLIRDLQEESAAYPQLSIIEIRPPWIDSRMTRAIYPDAKPDWGVTEDILPLYDQFLATPIAQHGIISP
ncbi:SDR family NAD(P)-dependent oxidoreductase [Suttonella ornithocola]|uniref:Uncharacterized oxidoreductase yciK n=1 Tax=Suttonella ornithocola TaxID=279832 RepID=A0A380MS01_9GAMM|nr:SDR family NAD(P)-dependent oxidoreductase [Suttonella ornithocola]SUO95370.1 Uncharacterized oxidoreductase yciK [Suttonella ornithocola]